MTMKRIFRQSLSILLVLSLMLTLIPGSIQPVHADDGVEMRTTMLDLTEATVTYRNSDGLEGSANPTNTNITDTAEGWSWDSESNTLTLDGINLVTANLTGIRLPADSTIVLAEDSDNTVISTYNSNTAVDADCITINCEGNLDIQGTGSLSVQSGNTANNFSIAIYAVQDLTISGGTINASGGAAAAISTGLYSLGLLSIEGGTIDAKGEFAQYSFGINSNSDLAISEGTIDASGGNASVSSTGVYSDGNMTITGGFITADGASDGNITYSYGISSQGTLSVDGGTINATGGSDVQESIGLYTTGDLFISEGTVTVNSGNNTESLSYGIFARKQTGQSVVAISGGTVYASGGGETPYSIGICIAGDISIMGGTVTATGNYATDESYGIVSFGTASFSDGTVYANANPSSVHYTISAMTGINDENMTALQIASDLSYTQLVIAEKVEDCYTYIMEEEGTVATEIRITKGKATVSNKTVGGMLGSDLPGTDVITITLLGSTFKNLSEGDDVSAWFNNLPDGLSVTVSEIALGTAELVFSGTPTTVSDETMSITIPKGKLNTASNIEVIRNSNTKFDIVQEQPRTTMLDLTVANVTYKMEEGGNGSGNPASTNITDTAEGWLWYKHAADSYSANTLVLNGINLITTDPIAIKLPANATIVLVDESENNVESTYDGAGEISGIYGKGALTIKGNTGSLNVTSGISQGSSSAAFDVTGNFSISGGNISATGGSAKYSYGIRNQGSVTVSGGVVTAMGGTAVNDSNGISASSSATFSGGVIYLKTSTAPTKFAVYAAGITDNGMTVLQKDGNGDYTISLNRALAYYFYNSSTPASDIKIFKKYQLTIAGGGDGATANGSHEAGSVVTIHAGTKSGYLFSGWTTSGGGSFADATLANTTFTMPSANVTITANWIEETQAPVTYQLTVAGGGDGATASGYYEVGADVTIHAGTESGYLFSGWTTSGGGSFANATLANTTFTMPGANVTITANWTEVTGNNGGGNHGGSGSGNKPSPAQDNGSVIVNGQSMTAGSVKTEIGSDGRITATFTVDAEKLNSILASEKSGAKVVIPFKNIDKAVGKLTGEMVKAMENKDATLIIQTDSSSYTLPAMEINIKEVSKQFGTAVAPSDIIVSVSISAPSSTMVKLVENASKDGSFTMVVPAVEFTVTCTYGGKTVNVTGFSDYVERTIVIPDGVDPAKITTGIVVSPNGTVHHVPTRVEVIDGKYHAVINSLTNSTYAVVWNPVAFSDMDKHWAKNSVNNMGSRMVVTGVANNKYEPNREITRAEFAAIIIRALGLEPGTDASSFKDVKVSDWYNGTIQTAVKYGIIKGYREDIFAPNDTITREQAITMIGRAMKLTGLSVNIKETEADNLMKAYKDGTNVSNFAVPSIAACLKTEIVTGRSGNLLAPKSNVTRAEAATMMEKLLQKSDLI